MMAVPPSSSLSNTLSSCSTSGKPASDPRVSVIVPACNAAVTIGETLDSILANRWPNLEIFVVDDHSTDDTAGVAGRYPGVSVLQNSGKGIAAAHNTALACATGKYTMRCDADDLFASDRIGFQVAWMEAHPDTGAFAGLLDHIWSDGRRIDVVAESDTIDYIHTQICNTGKVPVRHPTIIFRTEALREVGGCRDFFVTNQDDDLVMRIAEKFRVARAHRVVYTARLHRTSITRRTTLGRLQWFVQRAEEFQRDRLAGRPDALQRGQPPEIPTEFHGPPARPPRVFARQLAQSSSWRLLNHGQAWLGLQVAARGVRFDPSSPSSYLHIAHYLAVLARRSLAGWPLRASEADRVNDQAREEF